MDDPSWIVTSWQAALMTLGKGVGIYIGVVVYTRLAGLRTFSKMSSFDFAMTVAVGSIIASTVLTRSPPLLQALAALAGIYLLQIGTAVLRVRSDRASRAVDNRPVLLMEGGEMIDDAMRAVRVTRADLIAKLREANVVRMSQVEAVVMESTGDISVLHSEESDLDLDDILLEGVRRY